MQRQGQAEALVARLQAAADSLAAGQTDSGCAAICTYQAVVSRLSAVLLSPVDRAELLADAARIAAVAGC